jgi:hypothetical protein
MNIARRENERDKELRRLHNKRHNGADETVKPNEETKCLSDEETIR